MKIGFVSPYDFNKPGGVNRHISGLADELVNKGHSVKILGISSKDLKYDTKAEFVNLGGSFSIGSGGTVASISLSPLAFLRMKNILQNVHFDVLHIHEPLIPVISLGALLLSKSPVVATFHASSNKTFKYKIIRKMLNHAMTTKINKRIAVSNEALKTASKYVSGEFDIIPNGIDFDHFSVKRTGSRLNFGEPKKNILFFGRNEPRKGIPVLLKAFSILRSQNNNVRLILAGPGTDEVNASEFVKKEYCEDIICVGEIDYSQQPNYFHASDCFCSPATGNESFGIVILEAMASSLPVVVSDISGYNELVVDGRRGILFEKGNAESLAFALNKTINNSKLTEKLIEEGKNFSKNYDWQNLVETILESYESVAIQKG